MKVRFKRLHRSLIEQIEEVTTQPADKPTSEMSDAELRDKLKTKTRSLLETYGGRSRSGRSYAYAEDDTYRDGRYQPANEDTILRTFNDYARQASRGAGGPRVGYSFYNYSQSIHIPESTRYMDTDRLSHEMFFEATNPTEADRMARAFGIDFDYRFRMLSDPIPRNNMTGEDYSDSLTNARMEIANWWSPRLVGRSAQEIEARMFMDRQAIGRAIRLAITPRRNTVTLVFRDGSFEKGRLDEALSRYSSSGEPYITFMRTQSPSPSPYEQYIR